MTTSVSQPTMEIMPSSDRYALAQLIAVRYPTPTKALVCALMAQQYYAIDHKAHEWGIATCLDAEDGSYSVWVFQSLANPRPGYRDRAWLQFQGNCQAHQEAVDHADADAWSTILEALPATAAACDLF